MVHFGPYGLFGAMSGPSCCISVPFLFKNYLTKDQASIEGISSISNPFGPVSGPFRPIWSILDHRIRLGPCLVHRAAFLFHFCSVIFSQKIKSVKKDFSVRLDPYLIRFGPYGPFWPIWSIWDHVWSILLHFCSISVQNLCPGKIKPGKGFSSISDPFGPTSGPFWSIWSL